VTGDDTTDICQPDADPFEFIGAMQPLEYPKEQVRMPHVKTNAVITHEYRQLTALSSLAPISIWAGSRQRVY